MLESKARSIGAATYGDRAPGLPYQIAIDPA